MPRHNLTDHAAPENPNLRNDHEKMQLVDEVDQSGSDKHNDKNPHNPSHEAEVEHGFKNEHEQEKPRDEVESNQNYYSSSNEDEDEDQDDDDEYKNEDDEEEDNEDEDQDMDEDEDGCITINLSDVRKEFQCPICLGIIRKTRTFMQCLHRFCRECIDKSMRMGNNECPVCRAHCASRRSLRDDPIYDNLISLLYPDIDKYEEEEMTLQEDEMIQNNQIQASIAETCQRQEEAGRKRRCRNSRNAGGFQVSNDNDYDVGKGSSSGVEKIVTEPKEDGGQETQFFQESSSINAYANRKLINSSNTLTLGINPHQINTTVNGENAGSSRLSRLIDHLRNLEENDDQLEIHLMLVSLDDQRMPSLQEPYLCCRPTVSMKILFKYVALKVGLQADQLELYLVEDPHASIIKGERSVDPEEDKLRVLREEETLAELYALNAISCGHMLLAYKMK